MAHYRLIADFETASGDINGGFVNNPFNGVFGWIEDEHGNRLGKHYSSTLSWLEQDLLGHVPFDPEHDSYEKNW